MSFVNHENETIQTFSTFDEKKSEKEKNVNSFFSFRTFTHYFYCNFQLYFVIFSHSIESGLFLTSTFDDILVNPGSNVIISCSASGSPLPQSAYWLFNGKPIDAETDVSFGKPQVRRFPSEVTLTLNLTSIDLNNSGLYSCIFQNDLARVSHSARLNVHGNPIVHDSMVLGPEGSNITLECRYGGYPIHSISWEKGEFLL